jgi:trehalose 2-sulfotransferase
VSGAVAGLPRPERSYLVCATPRSGSTLLCRALAATGLAGQPEEYFEARRRTGVPRSPRGYFRDYARADELALPEERPPGPDYSSLREVGDYREHLAAALANGTGSNGVFGAKLMWMHVKDFVILARTLPELEGADLAEILAALFPNIDYVWVRRRDDVRQAVSLWRAIQTQAWRSDAGSYDRHPPEYDFGAIQHLLSRMRADNEAWGAWFDEQTVAPLELAYEDVDRDLPGAVRTVLDRVGLDSADAQPPRPRMKRQSDELSEEWVERFRQEAHEPIGRAG